MNTPRFKTTEQAQTWANKYLCPTRFNFKGKDGWYDIVSVQIILDTYIALRHDYVRPIIAYVGTVHDQPLLDFMDKDCHSGHRATIKSMRDLDSCHYGNGCLADTFYASNGKNYISLSDSFMSNHKKTNETGIKPLLCHYSIDDREMPNWSIEKSVISHEYGHTIQNIGNLAALRDFAMLMKGSGIKDEERHFIEVAMIAFYDLEDVSETFADAFVAAYYKLPKYENNEIVGFMNEILKKYK